MSHSHHLLKSRGIPVTRQRVLILNSMRERRDHPDAEAVFASIHAKMPSLSLDTVYRTLDLLARKGIILKLALPTHRFHFDGSVASHDHFLCTACEGIFDIEGPGAQLEFVPEMLREIGEVHALQRVFLGACHACAGQPSRARKARRDKSAGGEAGNACARIATP